MKNQTCFNLSEAVGQWREEMSAQPGVSPEQTRELELHLCDSVVDLQQRGLTEEEGFWLARRRLGVSQKIAEEMVKVDSSRVWTDRVLWMVMGVLVTNFFQTLVHVIYQNFVPRQYYRSPFGFACAYTLLVIAAVWVARGRVPKTLGSWLGWEKVRFSILIIACISAPTFFWGSQLFETLFPMFPLFAMRTNLIPGIISQYVLLVAWPLVLSGVAFYLRSRLRRA
jgi:hypothetical protein